MLLKSSRYETVERQTVEVRLRTVDPRAVERARAVLALAARGVPPAGFGEPSLDHDIRRPGLRFRGASRRAEAGAPAEGGVRGDALGARGRDMWRTRLP